MKREEARQGLPDTQPITDAQATAERGERIPAVHLIVELEADPRIEMHFETPEDRRALITWTGWCRPDIHAFLAAVSREISEKKKAA